MKISEWEYNCCELLSEKKLETLRNEWEWEEGIHVNSREQREEFCHPSSRNRKWVKTSLLTFWPMQITFPPSPIPAAVWSPPSLPRFPCPTCFLYASLTPWFPHWGFFILNVNLSSETTFSKQLSGVSVEFSLTTPDSNWDFQRCLL